MPIYMPRGYSTHCQLVLRWNLFWYVSFRCDLSHLIQHGKQTQALQLYTSSNISQFKIPSFLKSCAAVLSTQLGKSIHAYVVKMGLQYDPFISSALISMYGKCGSLAYAQQVFVKLSERDGLSRDITIWNNMINGYFRFGHFEDGIGLMHKMQLLGVKADAFTVSMILGVCDGSVDGGVDCYMLGKEIHGYILRNLSFSDPFLQTALISMYSSCGRPGFAWRVFENVGERSNIAVWNSMISGFCENRLWGKSLELFSLAKIQQRGVGSASFTAALTACSQGEDAVFGRQIHSDVVKIGLESDAFVCTSLLTMYSKCGFVEETEKVFEHVRDKPVELWNAVISGYLNNGCVFDAFDIFLQMRTSNVLPDSFTMANLLSACCVTEWYDFGRMVHAELTKRPIQSGIALQGALLNMYSKSGITADASAIFCTMKEKDVVAWGSMISGLSQYGKIEESVEFFRDMLVHEVKPDSDIFSSLVGACLGDDTIDLGCQIHGFSVKNGFDSDVFVANSLIEMYSRSDLLESSIAVFSTMPYKNLVSWNSMISCYCRNGNPDMSVSLLTQIEQNGLHPDSVSLTNALVAVSSKAQLLKGRIIHGYLVRYEISSDLQLDNALVDMYIKCGSLEYARKVFKNMPRRNLVTWNSMITGFASHGKCLEAIKLFNDMKLSKILPDDVTFLSLISSCSHSGFINEGLNLFNCMTQEYRIVPRMEHYVNGIDLLGRAGRLEDAYRFIETMPVVPDRGIWQCLLSACRAHRNVELGELAAQRLLQLEPDSSSSYIQLLLLYGDVGLKEKAAASRALMKEKRLKKTPGCSWIEVRNKSHVFFSGDVSSQWTIDIYETLSSLRDNMKREEGCYDADNT